MHTLVVSIKHETMVTTFWSAERKLTEESPPNDMIKRVSKKTSSRDPKCFPVCSLLFSTTSPPPSAFWRILEPETFLSSSASRPVRAAGGADGGSFLQSGGGTLTQSGRLLQLHLLTHPLERPRLLSLIPFFTLAFRNNGWEKFHKNVFCTFPTMFYLKQVRT